MTPNLGGPTKNLPKIRTNILHLQVLSILPCGETNPLAWSVSLGWWRSLTWPRSASVLVPLSIFYFPWHLGVMVSPEAMTHKSLGWFRGPTQLQWGKRMFTTQKKMLTSSSDNICNWPVLPFSNIKWRDWKVFWGKKTNSSKRLCCSGGVRYWLNSTLIDSCFNRDCSYFSDKGNAPPTSRWRWRSTHFPWYSTRSHYVSYSFYQNGHTGFASGNQIVQKWLHFLLRFLPENGLSDFSFTTLLIKKLL